MTEVEALCRKILSAHLKLVEDFCEEAVYANDKEVRESEILEDSNFPNEFRIIRDRYGNPRNFINLLHRELKKLAKEEYLPYDPSLQEIVQISRLFLKESKAQMEKLKDYANSVGVPALILAIEEFKHLKKQEKSSVLSGLFWFLRKTKKSYEESDFMHKSLNIFQETSGGNPRIFLLYGKQGMSLNPE